MADALINIAQPVLVAGQYFKVRYRKLPGGSFSSYTNHSSNSFTITGLDADSEYEFEVLFYNGVLDCDTRTFTVKTQGYTCPENINAEIVQNGSIFEVKFTYTDPVAPFPPCGYQLQWNQSGAAGNVNLIALPTGGEYRMTIPQNIPTSARLYINDCQNTIECFSADLPPADTVCEPIVITNVTITPMSTPGYWAVRIFFNQSTPRTLSGTITWLQTNPLPPGGIPDSGSATFPFVLSPTTNHTFPVKPTPNPQVEIPTYRGTLTDVCGNVHHWSV